VVNPVVINVYLLVVFLLATLPFLNQRLFGVFPVAAFSKWKPFYVRMAEWLVLFFVALGIGLFLEDNMGSLYPKDWEFYVIFFFVFVVFAVPGYIWQYQLKKLFLGK